MYTVGQVYKRVDETRTIFKIDADRIYFTKEIGSGTSINTSCSISEFKKWDYYARLVGTQSSDPIHEIIEKYVDPRYFVRIYNSLKRSGIRNLDEFYKLSEEEVLHMRNMGRKSTAIVMNIINFTEEKEEKEESVATRRLTYLSPSREYFNQSLEKYRSKFTFDQRDSNGINWPDYENYIIRLTCHAFGACTIDQLNKKDLIAANKFATDVIDLLFDANIKYLKEEII